MAQFESGTSYPIHTLPDDLYDEAIPHRDRWAIKDALFWNDCQGWWIEGVAEYTRGADLAGEHAAQFWMPLPPAPMSREAILAERNLTICPTCDLAIDPSAAHDCRPSAILVEQRELQARADRRNA
jgi:hypothetical protein